MTAVSVVIPSFRRPAELSRCLAGIGAMSTRPGEVVVVLRPDDAQGRAVAAAADARIVDVFEPGHLPPLVAAIRACRSDVMAVIDDDAVPRVDWLSRIVELFADPKAVLVTGPVHDTGPGGREIARERAAHRAARRLARRGGRTWYGGFAVLPPPGASERRHVVDPVHASIFTGNNVAYRRDELEHVGIDLGLNRGAAIGYEADLALGLRRRGRVLFDPKLIVDHLPAKRTGAPDRDDPERGIADYTYNLFYIAAKHFGLAERIVFRAYMATVGQRPSPGIVRVPFVSASSGIPVGRLVRLVRDARRGGTSRGREARSVSRRTSAC